MNFNPLQFIIGLSFALLISLLAWRLRTLSTSGMLAATLLGTVVFGLGGLGWAVLLVTFFVTSSGFSRLRKKHKSKLSEKFSKGSQRDASQVLANGGVAGLFVLVHAFFPQSIFPWLAYAGAMAAVNADTWGTELGVLSGETPRLITNGRLVERGESGGITLAGTAATFGGGLLIALLAAFLGGTGLPTFPIQSFTEILLAVTLGGFLGSLVDSYLGATVQAYYYCPVCEKQTEHAPVHTCGTPTQKIRGFNWLDNDAVNAICALTGSVTAVLIGSSLM